MHRDKENSWLENDIKKLLVYLKVNQKQTLKDVKEHQTL